MIVDQRVFVYRSKYVAAGNVVAHTVFRRVEVPFDMSVEGLGVDTARNVDTLTLLLDRLKGSLNTTVGSVSMMAGGSRRTRRCWS